MRTAGGPALTGYELRYREHPGGAWTDLPHDGTAAEATITGLKVNTAYEVRIRISLLSVQSSRTEPRGAWNVGFGPVMGS